VALERPRRPRHHRTELARLHVLGIGVRRKAD
jgi:hypothetical protein